MLKTKLTNHPLTDNLWSRVIRNEAAKTDYVAFGSTCISLILPLKCTKLLGSGWVLEMGHNRSANNGVAC